MKTPKSGLVSVIIPTYKGSYRLIRAIKSVLSQDYNDIEVLVIDDNPPFSKERLYTKSIMEQFASDPRVSYVEHISNSGGAAARNTGFEKSEGEYICLLDDDDFFYNNKISKQVEVLKANISFSAVSCHFEKSGQRVSMDIKEDYSYELLMLQRAPHTSSLMIRSSVFDSLQGFDVRYKRHQDYEFLLRFFRHNKISILNEDLVVVDGGGHSNDANGVLLESLKVQYFEDFKDVVDKFAMSDKSFIKRMYAVHYSDVVFAYLRSGMIKDAFRVSVYLLRKSRRYALISLFKRAKLYIDTHFHLANKRRIYK
jgi:glycosyltransferase involved in cell wall biosynthesis